MVVVLSPAARASKCGVQALGIEFVSLSDAWWPHFPLQPSTTPVFSGFQWLLAIPTECVTITNRLWQLQVPLIHWICIVIYVTVFVFIPFVFLGFSVSATSPYFFMYYCLGHHYHKPLLPVIEIFYIRAKNHLVHILEAFFRVLTFIVFIYFEFSALVVISFDDVIFFNVIFLRERVGS
jgi:hypothetical protein